MTRTPKNLPFTSEDFVHDAMMIRTTDAKARAHGGFVWPREIGAVVVPKAWVPDAVCGGVVRRDAEGRLLGIRAAMIGQHGTVAGVLYRLNDSDEFEACED